MAPAIKSALRKWKDVLGDSFVSTSNEDLSDYEATLLPHSNRPAAILRPGSAKEIQALVKIASKYRIPIYPISCGKNWGYGSASPVRKGQVVVDLGRLNRIIEVNEKLAYAIIEPGVTQGMLYNHLKEKKLNLWQDITGAGPNASIIGNTVERGFGHTPVADHFQHSCGYEAVLPDGSLIKTGFGHYASSEVTNIYKTGVGPSLDGLFTQSNFGIVTKMTVWLFPKPEHFEAYAFKMNEAAMVKVVEALRPLRISGLLQSALHIANDLRVISGTQAYPWDQTHGITPLPDTLRRKMREERSIGEWNALGVICGSKKTVDTMKFHIKKALNGLVTPIFITDQKLKWGKSLAAGMNFLGIGKKLAGQIAAVEQAYRLLRGEPQLEPLRGIFWRSHEEIGVNEKVRNWCEKGAGLMWLSPIVPPLKESINDLLGIVNPILKRFKFDPLITLTMINSRAITAVISVNYNKNDPHEKKSAADCYKRLFYAVMKAGFIVYRAGITSQKWLATGSEPYWETVRRLKKTLDPSGILAPGRYSPLE